MTHEEAMERIVVLEEALRAASKMCGRCHGKGAWTTSCSLCGDSTYDHMCNDETVACDKPECVTARAALKETSLSEPTKEDMAKARAQAIDDLATAAGLIEPAWSPLPVSEAVRRQDLERAAALVRLARDVFVRDAAAGRTRS